MKKVLLLLALYFSSAFSQVYSTGLIFDDEAYQNTPKTAKLLTRDFKFLPVAVSLEAYAPEVGDQGHTGTCTAWATAYGARTIIESIAQHRLNKRLTTNSVFSPSYIYNQIRRYQGCQRGTSIGEALGLMKREGVAKFDHFGFDCNRMVRFKDKKLASSYKIKDYKKLFGLYSSNKIQPIKKALSEKNPVLIGMETPDSFSKRKEHVWQPKEQDYYQSNLGGHAMVVVGYDDNIAGGSFRLMNSWGRDWGDGGFKWIRYRDFKHFVKYSYEMIPNLSRQSSIKLGGALKFMDSNGNVMNVRYNDKHHFYQMNQAYKSGTRFNFFIKNAQPAYLYAFGLDSGGKVSTIFPHNKGVSAFLSYKNSSIAFPDEESHIRLDNQRGKDYFVVLYSKNKLNIDAIKHSFSRGRGSVNQRLQAILGKRLIHNRINFSKNFIDFSYNSNRNNSASIVAIVIEFDHI